MKRAKKSLMAMVMTSALVVGSLGSVQFADAAAKKPTKITMNAKTVLVKVKGKTTLKVKSVKPAKASKKVTFKSAKKKIATVNAKGVVTGKKAGTTTITVTSKVNKKVKATVKVIVAKVVPTKVTLSEKSLSMNVGDTATLKATVAPKKAYAKGATWKSSDAKVATVKSGKVTAVAAGTAKITYTTLNGKKATCTVTVAAPAAPSVAPTQPASAPAASVSPSETPVTTTDAPSQPAKIGDKDAKAYTVSKDTAYTITLGSGDSAVAITAEQIDVAVGTEISVAAAQAKCDAWNDANKISVEKEIGAGKATAGELQEDGSRPVVVSDVSEEYNGSYNTTVAMLPDKENTYAVEAKATSEGQKDVQYTVEVSDSESAMTFIDASGEAVARVKINEDGSKDIIFTDEYIAKKNIAVKVPVAPAQ